MSASQPGSEEEAPQAPPETALERLRRKREDIRSERYLDLEVPGYGGELVIRYRPIPWDVLKRIGGKMQRSRSPKKELLGFADTLVAACDAVLIRQGDGLVSISPDDTNPVRFDDRLADLLGFTAGSAREVVFGTYENDLAVTAQHNEVAQWMQDSKEATDDDEEFLGK